MSPGILFEMSLCVNNILRRFYLKSRNLDDGDDHSWRGFCAKFKIIPILSAVCEFDPKLPNSEGV